MVITKEEFCLFNVKSKIKLMEKDAQFLTRKICENKYLVSLYEIYGFYVETTYDFSQMKTIRVDPILSLQVLDLYPVVSRSENLN